MSAARRLSERPIPALRPKRRLRQKKQNIKPNVEYIHYNTRPYRIPFRILFTVILIFAGGVGAAFTSAYLQHMRQEIDRAHAAIGQQRVENAAASAEMARHLTVEEISYLASTRLNMGPPDISQIIRINVPRQSYVVQSEALNHPVPEGMWQSAWWHIRNWLGVQFLD